MYIGQCLLPDDKIKSLEVVLGNCKRYLSDPKSKREIEKNFGRV